MDVLIVLVFVSLVLVAAGLLFLVHTLRAGDAEHADRLSLLPLKEERELEPECESESKENS